MKGVAVACAAVVAVVTLAGCGGSSGSGPGDRDGGTVDAGGEDATFLRDGAAACSTLDFDAFDAAVTSFLTAQGLSGASAVVVSRDCGIVHTRGYGQFTADRLYLFGSSSKIVSVGVLMKLVDQGLLDIDAPIGDYLSSWGPNGKPELEVAQLLSNSSGLVGLVDRPLYLPYRCQYQDTGTLEECAQTIYTASDASDRQPPDTSFHYGGGQWQLAGGIAEVVSGKSWAQLIRETYGETCGVPDLGYTNQFAQAAQTGALGSAFDYPSFFQASSTNLPSTDNPSIEGGLYATVESYGKILLMHLRGGECSQGRVLSASSVARMQVDRILEAYDGSTAGMTGRTTGAGAFDGYGLGWWIDRMHPGVFADPGLYGSFPWLDRARGYAALVALEANSGEVGGALWHVAKPTLDAVFEDGMP